MYLLPSSPLDLTGVASYEIFLRGAFDKLGVQPDFLRIGEYKTAPSQLTEKEMTPAHREMTESINRDTYDRLVKGIAEARELTEDDVRALMDRGPLLASEAVAGKLVDGVAYEDELDDKVPALREGRRSRGPAGSGELSAVARLRVQRLPFSVGRPRVAVLYAVGTIVSGRGGFDATDGALVGTDAFVEEIRRIKDDSSIRAVVLRIDSPGGSSVASDVIWRELTLLRQDNPSRPLVVSMGDLAASGGYYIATPADEIVAQPSTLTGSIGIFVGKFALGQGLEKLGVTDAGRDRGPERRHLLAVHALHRRAADARAGVPRRLLQGLRRQGGRVPQEDARRRSTPWRRAACGPARRRASAAWWIGWAGWTWRSRRRRSGPASTPRTRWRWWSTRTAAPSTRRSRISSAASRRDRRV